ncbi:MAG TPA: CAP family protein [Nonomuraea sp.]|nr:CAP family protein [Nonomuraea sp.]
MEPIRDALPDATDVIFREEALAAANSYRAKHGAPKLEEDAELTKYAMERAASRSRYNRLDAGHDGLRDDLGENIFWGGGKHPGADAVNLWYDEIKNYDWSQPPGDFMRTGHFTQLVWVGSTKVGMGRVYGAQENESYIVFVFSPPGNYEGQYGANVLPARS